MIDFQRRRLLMKTARLTMLGLTASTGIVPFLSGCKTMDTVNDLARSVSFGTGDINSGQVNSLIKSGQAIAYSFEDFTPEQEYYIGRTLGALILEKYPVFVQPEVNFYLNILGQSLAQFCDVPETFAGYHFLALDSPDINALAAPGGFIFVTRGLMHCCRTEDSLAAVLAHEIAHIQAKHGLQAIKQSRITNAFTVIGVESARHLGGQKLSQLTETFGQTISDISKTLITKGYSRTQEYEADAIAITLLNRVGYDPSAIVDLLTRIKEQLQPGRPDFGKTHPGPDSRINKVVSVTGPASPAQQPLSRQQRFDRLVSLI